MPPLKQNSKLTQAALAKANDMLQFDYWDHFSPAKSPPWKFILEAEYNYRHAGENLGKDFLNEEELVQAWLDSPEHRANILSDKYEDTGVAVVKGKINDKDTILVVQMFGKQFTTSEIASLEKNGGSIISDTELRAHNILVQKSRFDLKSILQDKFSLSKIIASVIVLILILLLCFDISKSISLRQFGKKAKKYWGNLVFLIILGGMIIFTQNGF